MNTNTQTQEKKSENDGTWKVLVPIVLLLLGLGVFSLKLIFKKKAGKRLAENDKSLDRLDYVKQVPTKARADDPSLADLPEEEREYIAEILQKTSMVSSNY